MNTNTRHISPDRACVFLSAIKEFKNLSLLNLEAIAQVCHWHRYEEGEEIVRYHDQSNSVFLITQGEVRVNYYSMSGKEVILCDLPAGEIFGELTAIDGQSRSASVVAKSSSLLASISSSAFQELIFTNRQIAAAILQRLTGQIRRLTERVIESDTLKVPNRVRAKLLHLAHTKSVISNNQAIISSAPTHVELANLIGTHREAVTREINALKKEKIIQCNKDHEIHILDVARLTEMVENNCA